MLTPGVGAASSDMVQYFVYPTRFYVDLVDLQLQYCSPGSSLVPGFPGSRVPWGSPGFGFNLEHCQREKEVGIVRKYCIL